MRERAEEEGYLPDELAVELVRNGLKELDQEELVEHYRALSKYLAEAKVLGNGYLVQASEKLWDAAALAVKMVAARRGLKLEKHVSLWDFVSRLSMERGDRDIIRLFNAANGVRNFYEDQMNREALSYKILRSSLN